MQVKTEIDVHHVDHNFDVVETIHDNSVEKTTWARCFDCEEDFVLRGTTIIFDEEDRIEWNRAEWLSSTGSRMTNCDSCDNAVRLDRHNMCFDGFGEWVLVICFRCKMTRPLPVVDEDGPF